MRIVLINMNKQTITPENLPTYLKKCDYLTHALS